MAPPRIDGLSTYSPVIVTPDVVSEERQAPLRRVRVDEYIASPSGGTYHALGAAVLPGVAKPKEVQGLSPRTLAVLAGPPRQEITCDASGRLGIDGSFKSGEELSAIVLLSSLGLKAPFAACGDPRLLAAMCDRLLSVHSALRSEAAGNPADRAQAASACLSLLLEGTARAHALGQGALERQLIESFAPALRQAPSKEQHFYAGVARRLIEQGRAPGLAGAEWLPDNSAPPYAQWKKDGVIRAMMYVDDNGTPRSRMISTLESWGFVTKETRPNGETVFRKNTQPLPTEVVLAPNNGSPPIFEKVGDSATDFVVYSGHAGYGQQVRSAASGQTSQDGRGQLLVLLQCSGIYSSDPIAAAHPRLQLVSTTKMSNDGCDLPMLSAMFAGFAKGDDWATIHDAVQKAIDGSGIQDPKGHYFYPNNAQAGAATDLDADGLADGADSLYDQPAVIYTSPLTALSGLSSSSRATSAGLMQSIEDVALVLRNAHFFDAAMERKLAWAATWVSDGVFTPDAGQNEAFRFVEGRDGKLHVAVSSRYASARRDVLSRLLALELGAHLATRGALPDADALALSLGLLERVEHQARLPPVDPFEESMIFDRYGLSPRASRAAMQRTQDPETFEPTHFAAIRAGIGAQKWAPSVRLPKAARLSSEQRRLLDEGKTDELARALGFRSGALLGGGAFVAYDGRDLWELRIDDGNVVGQMMDIEAIGPRMIETTDAAAFGAELKKALSANKTMHQAIISAAFASHLQAYEWDRLSWSLPRELGFMARFVPFGLTEADWQRVVAARDAAPENQKYRAQAKAIAQALKGQNKLQAVVLLMNANDGQNYVAPGPERRAVLKDWGVSFAAVYREQLARMVGMPAAQLGTVSAGASAVDVAVSFLKKIGASSAWSGFGSEWFSPEEMAQIDRRLQR